MGIFSKIKATLSKINPYAKKLQTVYIVEDNPIERFMPVDHLSKYKNLQIKEYPKGVACIKDIEAGTAKKPDLVIMNYFLDSVFDEANEDLGAFKKLDGLESLPKIKQISPQTNVIMFSSVNHQLIIDNAKKKGALDYIVKSATGFKELDSALSKHFSLEN